MTPAVDHGEHIRRSSSNHSSLLTRDRHSPRRRSSPRKDRSPVHHKGPQRTRSPSSTRRRSPSKERPSDRARSPKHTRSRSPIRPKSPRSLSPRTKRLKRTQAEREAEKLSGRDHGRSVAKEEFERGRHGDREESRGVSGERRSVRDKDQGGSLRSLRHEHSVSPEERNHKRRYESRSPPRSSRGGARDEVSNSRATEQVQDGDPDSVAKMKATEEALASKDKQKPSFELSGKLADETNRVRGITLLFTEPADARKPDVRWRLYVFKGGEVLNDPLYVHRQTCYLFGRERRVADIPTDHPSCSKQHAVLQFRIVEKEKPDGLLSKEVRPYLMDLGSTNGTYINESRIEPQRYYELFEKDTVKFGNSSREYVLLHENSAG